MQPQVVLWTWFTPVPPQMPFEKREALPLVELRLGESTPRPDPRNEAVTQSRNPQVVKRV